MSSYFLWRVCDYVVWVYDEFMFASFDQFMVSLMVYLLLLFYDACDEGICLLFYY